MNTFISNTYSLNSWILEKVIYLVMSIDHFFVVMKCHFWKKQLVSQEGSKNLYE